jgi:hypothetical protein
MVLAVACTLIGAVHFVNMTFDDVFISFRYADNLARGHGLVFNLDERVEGYSNFLWTVFLALPVWLGVDRYELGMLWFAKVVGALLGIATLFVVSRTAALGKSPRKRLSAPLAALYLATSAPFLLWNVGGLETPLVTLLLALSVFLHLREDRALSSDPQAPSIPWSYALLCLAALTRPEPAALIVPLAALRIVRRVRRVPGARTLLGEARWLALFAVPYALFLAFRYAYYGELLPNTYYAKMYLDHRVTFRGASYLERAVTDLNLLWLAVACAVPIALSRWVSYRAVVALVLLAAQLGIVVREGGDWMPAYRLLAPMLPLVALLVVEAWDASGALALTRLVPRGEVPAWIARPSWVQAWKARLERLEQQRWAVPLTRGARVLARVALVVGIALGSLGSFEEVRVRGFVSGLSGVKMDAFHHFEIARWMRREIREPGLLALGEAGVVPYYTGLPVLDLFGLTDKHIAHQRGTMHHKLDVDYAFSRKPKYVLLLVQRLPDGRLTSTHAYAETLLAEPRFEKEYVPLHEFERAILFVRREYATPSAR